MHTTLIIAQVISALLLVLTIMSQERGGGMGEAIGGASGAGFQTSKRGAEKVMAQITLGLLIIFVVLSLLLNFI